MKKNTRIILITILIITGITYIPTLTLPLVIGMKIDPNKNYTSTHSGDRGYYRLHVKKGEYYSLTIQWDDYANPTVDVYTSALKLNGIHRYSSSDIFIRFKAKHSGFYYVTIDTSRGETFRLYLDHTSPSEYHQINYYHEVNVPRLVLFGISAILCVLIVLLPPFMRFVERKKKEYEQSLILYCPDCGVKLRKSIGYCTHCGHTFVSPKTNKY